MLRNMGTVELDDFSGGLNTSAPPLKVSPNESPKCMDVHTDLNKTLWKRKGFRRINSSAASDTNGWGIYDYEVNSKLNYVLASFGSALYKMEDLDGSLTSIDDSFDAAPFYADTFNGIAILGTHSANQPKSYDGGAATAILTNAPEARYPVVWRNFVLWTGNDVHRNRYWWSTQGSYTAYARTSYSDIITHDRDESMGWVVLGGFLYHLKRYSIHRFTYRGTGVPPWTVQEAISNVGIASQRSVQKVTIPGKGEFVIFLGMDGRFYLFTGSEVAPISLKIEKNNGLSDICTSNLSFQHLYKVDSAVDDENHLYQCLVPAKGTTTNTHLLNYDYFNNSWWPYKQALGSITSIKTTVGQRKIFAVDYNGFMIQLNEGNADHAIAINAYWRTPRFMLSKTTATKKTHEIQIIGENIGAFDLTTKMHIDWEYVWQTLNAVSMYEGEDVIGSTFILGTSLLGEKAAFHARRGVFRASNFIQFDFTNNTTNPAFNIYGMSLLAKEIGTMKAKKPV